MLYAKNATESRDFVQEPPANVSIVVMQLHAMMRPKKMNENLWTILVIISAVVCRILSKIGFGFTFFSLLRSMLYIALYIGKGFSVGRRVIHKSVRHYLILIFVLMVFWFSIRTIKYFFIKDAFVSRHLWYAYYICVDTTGKTGKYLFAKMGKAYVSSYGNWRVTCDE